MTHIAAGPPERYFALSGRPLVQLRGPDGVPVLLALDPATGALAPSHALHHRLIAGIVQPDELDRMAFEALLHRWRARVLAECRESPITWSATGDPDLPYAALRAGRRLTLRRGRRPGEAPLTLLAEDQPIGELVEWPAAWLREGEGFGAIAAARGGICTFADRGD